jgi:uncharacterized membrane protein (DUF106 family)
MALEFLFNPLLGAQPALSILIFAFIILVIINVFYKVLVNQREAKAIKERQKDISKRMQTERKAGNMDKMNALMKESLQENSKMMKMTLKPMLVSFVIVIIFLPWLNVTYGDVFAPVNNGTGIVNLRGTNHTFSVSDSNITVSGATDYRNGKLQCDTANCLAIDGRHYEISKNGDNLKFSTVVAVFLFAVPILGYDVGWLGWYILVSIPLVIIIRKAMKIYI